MSKFDEEKQAHQASGYFREMKKQREENAKNEERLKAYEANTYAGKPPREFAVPPILTEEEMHKNAKDLADLKNENQNKLDKSGIEAASNANRFSMDDHYGDDKQAHDKAMERRQQRQAAKERQLERDRDHGNEMD